MNERIKELAEQAGFDDIDEHGVYVVDSFIDSRLERFAELVRQDLYQEIGKSVITQIQAATKMEREACAKLCEESYDKQIVHYPKGYYADPNKMGQYSQSVANRCAAAIRGRTE